MFIAGNISTGIRSRLLTPTTAIIRHSTTMKYGLRMANRDIVLLLFLHRQQVRTLRLHRLPRLQSRPAADDHEVTLAYAGPYLDPVRRLHPELHLARLQAVAIHHHDS